MARCSFRRGSGKKSDLNMAICWDFLLEINQIWSIFVVLRLCCPVVVTVTAPGPIRMYSTCGMVKSWIRRPSEWPSNHARLDLPIARMVSFAGGFG